MAKIKGHKAYVQPAAPFPRHAPPGSASGARHGSVSPAPRSAGVVLADGTVSFATWAAHPQRLADDPPVCNTGVGMTREQMVRNSAAKTIQVAALRAQVARTVKRTEMLVAHGNQMAIELKEVRKDASALRLMAQHEEAACNAVEAYHKDRMAAM